ncbi:MAG: hypothetical protein KIT84_35850 [Labilithrix sp.]|nr:hypothetical protein [Labilithrix sp.]MCW5816428.1 hypothetical protein [Labilithrix sp.]
MGILNLFSNRHKPLPDVFQYEALPHALRVQVMHLVDDLLDRHFADGTGWPRLNKQIAKEHGLVHLPGEEYEHSKDAGLNYILQTQDTVRTLDMIEWCFRVIGVVMKQAFTPQKAVDAVAELNQRFRMHGVGYEYVNGQIVRVDSQLLHAEAVIPALTLLATSSFESANKEFLSAHKHFREGRQEEAITDACKAFESTMKVICAKKKWDVDKNATASALIATVLKNGLVPLWSEEQLKSLDKCLIGVATVRNKNGGHGAGATPRDVPDHLAAYAMHLAASNIVFLVESYKALK